MRTVHLSLTEGGWIELSATNPLGHRELLLTLSAAEWDQLDERVRSLFTRFGRMSDVRS